MKPLLTLLLLFFSFAVQAQNTGCADTSYRMRFSSPGKDFTFFTHCNTADGGTVLIGRLTDSSINASDLVIIKLDATGGVVWKSKYDASADTREVFSRIIEQSNGEIAAYGYLIGYSTGGLRKMIVAKWSANGSLLWSKNYLLNSHFDQRDVLHSYFLSEGLNNDLLFSFKGEHISPTDALGDSTYAVIVRISNAGDVIWSRVFVGTENFYTHPSGVYQHNGEVYAFGYSDNDNAPCVFSGTGSSLYAMRLQYSSGDLLQLKTYCHSSGIPVGIGVPVQMWSGVERDVYNSVKVGSNRFALFGNFGPYDQNKYAYRILLDDQLNIVQAKQYTVSASLGFRIRIQVVPDGTTHLSTLASVSRNIYWCMLDSDNNAVRGRKLNFNSGDSSAGGFLNFGYRNSDVFNFSSNYRMAQQRYSLFTQLQRNDPTIDSCLGSDTSFVTSQPVGYSPNPWSWRHIVTNAVMAAPIVLTPSDFTINTENLCTQISRCDSLRIAGPDTLCVTDGFVSFTGLKNPDCRKRVLWEANHPLIDSSYQPNDSTLLLRFRQPQGAAAQTAQLSASAESCAIAKDTAQVVLLPGLKPLPPDTVVCGAISLRLTPGRWGSSYLWQDGSTDSVFLATDTGRYTVAVQTLCGNTFYDTMNISRPAVSLGSDVTVCKGDTVRLGATTGFVAYRWLPNANLVPLSDSTVNVFPSDTMQYVVQAQTRSGCTVSDTVVINVPHTTPINLGLDATFCEGDSLLLQAPPSFAAYQWSNGGTAPSISVNSSGNYWVKAQDFNGCFSKDSITILPLHPKPVVSVMPEGVVCIGQTDTLRVQQPFASYQWQTGSAASFLPVTDTGKFWVNVMDNNGCRGSDTVAITKLALPPASFLPPDTIVCAETIVELKPLKQFSRYLWSNGASSPSINVSTAALYTLRVWDANGCTGKDSITVLLKDCPNKIFFPSAFSPNGDGRNDIFKPHVEGRMLHYSFAVYNRWGQVVFATTDYRKGWGGDLSGVVQGNGAFVWVCHYRFSGEGEQMTKGTVMLIR